MWEWLERLFGEGFMPHGHCYLWTPSMVWTQVTSNLLIGLAYASIAATLVVLVRRVKGIPFAWAYFAFGVFILSCGLTHFFDIVTVWHPVYWADAGVRVVTAIASVATAVLMLPLVPRAVELANAARLSNDRAQKLEAVHAELEVAHGQLAARERDARFRAANTEEHFRELIDNLPELAWTAQPDGHIDFYNRRWFEYTGTTAEEMEGWGWEKVHDPSLLPTVVERWKHSLATGEAFEMEFPLRGADGNFRWFLTRVRPLRAADGKITRWFGINTDIDERTRTRVKLAETAERERAAREAAESATRLKDEFLAAVSHELRTPLNAILGWSRMLAGGQVPRDRMPKAIDTIERNALAQAQIVEDLLDISRIVSGKLRLQVSRVDLRHAIDAAVESLRPAMKTRDVSLEIDEDSAASFVRGDPARIQQVLWNVLGNAVKFSRSGGRVSVHVVRRDAQVEVTIADQGEGIPPDFLPYVFDAFRQADGSSTRRHGGLGIGLAISKRIIELHGGTIAASSAGEGMGASFVISLPAAEMDEDGEPSDPSKAVRVPLEAQRDIHGVKVLVVDDERDSREVIEQVLETSGAQVTAARSASEALAILEAKAFDIVIADIGMPAQDGYAFIAAAHLLPTMRNVPTAALTAFARAEDRKRILAAGFQMHIVKPVEPTELVAAVANLARIARSLS